jgi:predicted nucleotidyltransferase component of viral defense system
MARKPERLTPVQIRKIALQAVASDDVLVEHLVLKGGNALVLVHGVGQRASFDLDFSIENDFDAPEAMGERLRTAVTDRFDSAGYVVFDFAFSRRPHTKRQGQAEMWGGYLAEFKLLAREVWAELGADLAAKQRQAVLTGDGDQRVYRIEISKYEYCVGKEEAKIDEYVCYVYTLAMIAVEKIRAICQQMPDYTPRRNPTPRPRDFYDIYAIVKERQLELGTPQNRELLERMFEAKGVPFELLTRIESQREFHREAWRQVEETVSGELQAFDFYFDFVVALASRLHALGVK